MAGYGLVNYTRNMAAARADTFRPHAQLCHSLGQDIVAETKWIADRIRQTVPFDHFADFTIQANRELTNAHFTKRVFSMLETTLGIQLNAVLAHSASEYFFDSFAPCNTSKDDNWNVKIVVTGRRDFHASYTTLVANLLIGKKQWRDFWHLLVKYDCTLVYRAPVESLVWGLEDTYQEMLVAIKHYWNPPLADQCRLTPWRNQTLSNDGA